MSITVPPNRDAVYFNKPAAQIPELKDMIGINALSTDDAYLVGLSGIGIDGSTKMIKQVFKHIRVFSPSNKDFRYTHPVAGCPVQECPITIIEQRPKGNIFLESELTSTITMSNLRLVVDDGSKLPTLANAQTTAKVIFPVIKSNGEVELRTQATNGIYGNVYVNYMNTNYSHVKNLRTLYGCPITMALDLTGNVLLPSEASVRSFPKSWFLKEDWGDPNKADFTSVGYQAQAIYTIRSLFMMNRYGVTCATWYQTFDDKNVADCPFAHFGGGVWKNGFSPNNTSPKYIFKALDKFIQKAGNLKFHYALKEWEGDNKDVFAYILEENNTPKYMVAWRAKDVKDKTIAQMQALSQVENINITVNGVNYGADYSQPQNWWQLDGENNTPIDPSVYNPATGSYKLSPIPILIPIENFCNENSFAVGTLNIPAGNYDVAK
jgi:hypothetical protein